MKTPTIGKEHTPCICLRSTDSTLDIAFENNNELYLTFRKIKSPDVDVKVYMLDGFKNEVGNIFVNYGGQGYQINEKAAEAKILIKRKIANKENVNVKKIRGRKVS